MKTTATPKTSRSVRGVKPACKVEASPEPVVRAPDITAVRRSGVEDFGMFVELKTHANSPQIPALFKALSRKD